MDESKSEKLENQEVVTATLKQEIERVKRLREDVLLLRHHLARRTDLAKIIDPGDLVASEAALNSSLEVLENIERGSIPPVGHIAAASASLLDAIDKLVTAARMAQEQDGTGEEAFPVTPESLRACLPEADLAFALGKEPPTDSKRVTANEAKRFLMRKARWTVFWFIVAVFVHAAVVLVLQQGKNVLVQRVLGLSLSPEEAGVLKNILIPLSAFFWALVGSLVWILIRFRRFGAAYAFDPAHAEVFKARVLSGSITTGVLMYFVFGGSKAWAENWQVDLPLWGFILGYAGRLQVELISTMVDRLQGAISYMSGGKPRAKQEVRSPKASGRRAAPDERPREPETVPVDPDDATGKTPGAKG